MEPDRTLSLIAVFDSESKVEALLDVLRDAGFAPSARCVDRPESLAMALAENPEYELILSQYNHPGLPSAAAYQTLRESGLDLPFVIVSEARGEDLAVEAIRAGASDYVLMDGLARLPTVVERELRDRERRIKQREIEEQLRQSQKLDSIGQLAGGVAHDFNNLLTSIISFTRFVVDDLSPGDPRREDLLEVLRAADSATRLTSQLLAFSRKRPVEPVVVDINESIRGAHRMLRRTLGENVEVVSLCCDEPLHVWIDPGQLDQVIFNLSVNARDAMPDGGVLTIETSPGVAALGPEAATAQAIIEVRDNGVGIPPANLSKIFEPFFSTKGESGTGLGLATSYGIVRQAGGELRVSSAVGKGTTFTIALPITPDEPLGVDAPVRTDFQLPSGLRALVVEDQRAILQVMSRSLRSAGFEVTEARTAEEALSLVSEGAPLDLLVSDVVLPGLSGVELASRLRSTRPELAIVLASGYIDQNSDLEAAQGYSFLPKPFTVSQFLARVEKACRDLDRKT